MQAWLRAAVAGGVIAIAACGDSTGDNGATTGEPSGAGGHATTSSSSRTSTSAVSSSSSNASTSGTSSSSSGRSSASAGGGGAGQGGAGGAAPPEGGSAGVGGQTGCHGVEPPANRDRVVVVSHPYDTAGDAAPDFEVMKLDTLGRLTRPGTSFKLDTTSFGRMVFTPDGAIGIVVEDQCTLGVVRFDDAGTPTVVHAKFVVPYCASDVIIEPGGDTAIVLDMDTRANGGGLYRVGIGCDGTLTDMGIVAAGAGPGGIAFVGQGARAVVGATAMLDSTGDQAAHLLSVGDAYTRLGSADPFAGTEAIISALTVTHDEAYALVADDDQFSGIMNRLGVVKLTASSITPVQVLTPVADPFDMTASPFDGGSVLVLSGMSNALLEIEYDPTNAASPFTNAGELAYTGAPPELPGNVVTVVRGSLKGLALVSEDTAVRRVRFEPTGGITDLGPFELGGGLDQIPGAIGVAP